MAGSLVSQIMNRDHTLPLTESLLDPSGRTVYATNVTNETFPNHGDDFRYPGMPNRLHSTYIEITSSEEAQQNFDAIFAYNGTQDETNTMNALEWPTPAPCENFLLDDFT